MFRHVWGQGGGMSTFVPIHHDQNVTYDLINLFILGTVMTKVSQRSNIESNHNLSINLTKLFPCLNLTKPLLSVEIFF